MSYFSRGDRIFGKYVLSLVTCCILYVNIDFARQLSCLWAISINFCMQYLKETLFSTGKINCYITNIDITLCFSLFLDFAVLQFTRKYYFCRADWMHMHINLCVWQCFASTNPPLHFNGPQKKLHCFCRIFRKIYRYTLRVPRKFQNPPLHFKGPQKIYRCTLRVPRKFTVAL